MSHCRDQGPTQGSPQPLITAKSLAWATLLLLPLTSAAAGCAAQTPAQRASMPGTESGAIPFEKYQLPNGLTVILHRDTSRPLVAVSLWYDVGALHEEPGRSGFAHLFEHMMFQGSPNVGEDQHFRILEQLGATGVNGTTSFDRTNYFETVPAGALELVLWMESDRMGFLLESLTEKSLQNQIQVVKNERRQSVDGRPYGLMSELIIQTLYPKPHPYYGDVIGSMEDIGAATLKDVQDFFRTYYTPANATLTLAGDFKSEETKALVAKYFGPLSGRPKPKRPSVPPPTIEKPTTIDFEEPVGRLPQLAIVWPGPAIFSEDSAALDLLAYVISGTRSSRLDAEVSFANPLAQSVTAYFRETHAGGQFHIDLTLQPGRTLDEAVSAVDKVLSELRKKPPSQRELERAKNAVESQKLFGLQKLGSFGGRAEQLQSYQHYLGDPGRLQWDLARYRKVTLSDLSRVMENYLTDVRLVVKAKPKQRLSQNVQNLGVTQ